MKRFHYSYPLKLFLLSFIALINCSLLAICALLSTLLVRLGQKEITPLEVKTVRWLTRLQLFMLCSKVTVETEGNFKLQDIDFPVVIVSNHLSFFDIPILISTFPCKLGFVAKNELARIPVLNHWIGRIGSVYLNRKSPKQGLQAMQQAKRNLQGGTSMVIFPEGTRNNDPQRISAFKKGSFKLALESERPLLPVTIVGTNAIYPVRPNNPFPHVKAIVSRPIDIRSLSEDERQQLPEKIYQLINHNYVHHR